MENIIKLINEKEYEQALKEIYKLGSKQYTAKHAVLEAEILANLGQHYLEAIYKGLCINPKEYELYYMLANHYIGLNPDKAYLCYEQALLYCDKTDEHYIMECMKQLKESYDINVRPFTIVIPSYNCKQMMIGCIESIRKHHLQGTYEIIVVDNNSTDGIEKWLAEQEDVVFIGNKKNMGFGYACNQGVEYAAADNDIFFLNNDTYVPCNAIFNLRMSLYDDKKIGATGSVSNYVGNGQQIRANIDGLTEGIEYARQNNIPIEGMTQKKACLIGFALFIKREVLDKVGLFDLIYGKGNFEDNDISLRIIEEGYTLMLCHNSFIFHYGSQSFGKNEPEYNELLQTNRNKFKQKWGFDITYYTHSRNEIVNLIEKERVDSFKVLEIGCGMGATLAAIEYMFPNSEVYGLELDSNVARIAGKYMDIREGNIETIDIKTLGNNYDYIIFADVLEHLHNPKEILDKTRELLRDNGSFLLSIPNFLHGSVILPLMRGDFNYREEGILDKTHIHFFTLNSIRMMMYELGLDIDKILGTSDEEGIFEVYDDVYNSLKGVMPEDVYQQMKYYQYILRVK